MTYDTCHSDGEHCWFSDIDDQGCQGRFGAYVMEEAAVVTSAAAVPA
ncbi:hypothetical protein [Nonomuraea longicatena]|uniref:Uncharacterized protein n=1 Tax=Nonomuraea longicatena TaxID=83682 RepID=A0ABN1PEQ6_9ACTN